MNKLRLSIILVITFLAVHVANVELLAQDQQQSQLLVNNNNSTDNILQWNTDQVSLADLLSRLEERFSVTFLYDHQTVTDKFVSRSKAGLSGNPGPELSRILQELGLAYDEIHEGIFLLMPRHLPLDKAFLMQMVSGTVTDAQSGETLPGVNVLVKGTSTGTSTDSDGSFELNVESLQDTLIFSFVGYQTRDVPIEGRETIDVQMRPQAVEGDEVVITAFGMERERKALGYSTQEVSGDELGNVGETNFVSSLKGKVSGVSISESPTPGGSTGIIIRGANSISGNNQPLIVVDGIPIDNQNLDSPGLFGGIDYGDGIGNINAEDIKNINILKGPNAAAMYGARAANGAVIITTKSGRGQTRGVGLSYSSNISLQQLSVFPTFQNKWAGGYDDNTSAYGTTTYNGQEYLLYPSWLLDQWGPAMDGREVILQKMPELGPVPLSPQPIDNIKNFFDTGMTFTNTLAYSGGSETTSFRISASDLSNSGIVPKSTFDRNSVNLRIIADITDRLSIDGKANYIRQEGHNRPELAATFRNPFQNVILMPRFVDLDWLKDYKTDTGEYVNWKNSYPMNPYWVINELTNDDSRNRIIGFISAEYDFTNWLNLKVRTGTDTYTDERASRTSVGTPGTLNGAVENNTFNVQENNSDFMLTANGNLTEDFTGTLSLGGNHLYSETEITGNRGENLNVSGLYHISNARQVTPRYWLSRKEINSLYTMGQIVYKNFLFLDLTARNDWSSTLGEDNNSFFYPSASLSFAFTDALDMDSDLLTFGKLRASYAETGVDADPYLTNYGYNISSSSFGGQNFASIQGSIPLTNLKNELTTSYEFGTDLRFFNNNLGIDFTYYNSSTTNQILPVDISSTTGFSQRIINAGEIQNKGVEVLINATPIQLQDFQWNLKLNFSKNSSEVVSLASGVDSHILISSFGANIEARPGEPFGNIIGYEYKRNEQGQKVVTSDGAPQRADEQTILGNIQPDWLGGITNTFRYKGLSLSALIDIRQGGEVYSYSKYDQMAKGTGKFTEDRGNLVVDGVVKNPDGSYSPNTTEVVSHRYYAQRAWGNIGEEFVIDGSYIALREASVRYSFQPAFLSNTPLVAFDISLVGKNIFYIDRADEFEVMGITPESAYSRSAPAQGYEARNMPLPRSLAINVNLQF
ncbi:TonB-linked outer membrane protein, SusC/RagA family [Fodinibius roseus]|uniref:TonB-linked outer membrane protein, SusC/RagA family n=1 Tax=Fodinibius roseus TaxID=1194090 RepID=A0A1M5DSD3_9BACT|nr:SusC/RagA family TonB-linked outer membrane protein [Fodinibius roseus]SHF69893.1 TonB-linked outer membrane protein, SusC/RagA family [Fodinibius roseus]